MSVGFPQEWFVNVPEDGCICKICDGVANEPKQCMIGHLFCSYCLEIYSKIKGNANKCPTCNKTGSLGDKSPNLFASKVISTLPVFCPCHENNDTKNECGWTGKLIDRESRECDHVPIACPLQENGLCNSNCSGVIQRNQLSAHINEQGNKVEIVLTLVQQVRDLKHELSVLKSQTIAPVDQDVLITEKRKSPRVLDMPVAREDSSKRTKVETGSSKHQTTKVSSLVVKEKEVSFASSCFVSQLLLQCVSAFRPSQNQNPQKSGHSAVPAASGGLSPHTSIPQSYPRYGPVK
jgi:hypothetical protein